jgi:signal transduction histidine kinase
MKTFSHPSGGRRAATDLEEVLRGAVDVSRGEWRHVAEVSVEIPAALPTIRAVRDELGQVALNLVVNAAQAIADARRDGPGHIRVVAVEAEGGVRVDVSDDGCGMDEETRRRAFEPFFTTKEVGRGTGQGLTIVYDVVRRHGGRVEIASAVGVGTTFSVWLPLGIEGDGAVG